MRRIIEASYKVRAFFLVLTMVLFAFDALALEATLTPVQDACIYSDGLGTGANGAGDYFSVGTDSLKQPRRGLLLFNLNAALPANAQVTGATLTLHMSRTIGAAATVGVYAVSRSWTEGPADPPGNEEEGWPAVSGDVTWMQASYPSVSWTQPGGDYAAGVQTQTSVGDYGFYTFTGAALTAQLQAWLDTPASKFGWMLMDVESSA